MLWLSDEAIEYAVAKCRRERGYMIIVVVLEVLEQTNFQEVATRSLFFFAYEETYIHPKK